MTKFKSMLAAAAIAVTLPLGAPAMAQDFPLVAGEYTEVAGIFVNDGGEFRYAQHLADQWVTVQEFAKSQGWISDYKIMININPRDGEPHIYLTTTFASLPDAAEQARRTAAYAAWDERSRSQEQLIAESGNRAEYRTVQGSMLLQEYTPR
ncbi:MAG: hypothetical protein ABJP48_02420 [Erythrobacter sp.]